MTNAKVYFEIPNGPIAPGSSITAGVFLDTNVPINAFELSVIYPKDQLSLLGSDNSNSIVDIWQTKPESKVPGQVEFSGGILKSFAGTKGELIKLSFKILDTAKKTDIANLAFQKSSVYLADGQGTKVTATTENASLSIEANGQVISSPSVPFKSTSSDIIINQGLQNYKAQIEQQAKAKAESKQAQGFSFILIFVAIILVFCFFWVYNKYKRKQ